MLLTRSTVPSAPFRAPNMFLTTIDAIFDQFGPIPGLCFGTERSLIKHGMDLEVALQKLTLDYLNGLTSRDRFSLDTISNKIYKLRRSGVDMDSVMESIEPITPFIASKVVAQMRTLQHHELVHLFNRYIAFPPTRRMADDVFEAYCHIIFSTRMEFAFVPMVRIGGQPTAKKKTNSQWFSSHAEFKGSAQSHQARELEVLCASASASGVSLSISPSRVVDYSSDEIAGGLHIEADIYYIPITTNQVGIDSFILHDNNLYLLQMSVSSTHGISDKLLPFLVSLRGLPPKHNWHFIFIKPPREVLACPIPGSAELWDLDLYSAEVEVKTIEPSIVRRSSRRK